MENNPKINIKALNLSEIARKSGYSRSYVGYLLTGKRGGKKAFERVMNVVREQLATAD